MNAERYEFGFHHGQPFLRCLLCGQRTFHPEDIRHRYCPGCGFLEFVVVRSHPACWWTRLRAWVSGLVHPHHHEPQKGKQR